MLPLPSNGLVGGKLRHGVGRPVLHYPVDDVDQAAHDTYQRLLFGFPLLDLPLVVVVEHGVAEFFRDLRHLHLHIGGRVDLQVKGWCLILEIAAADWNW